MVAPTDGCGKQWLTCLVDDDARHAGVFHPFHALLHWRGGIDRHNARPGPQNTENDDGQRSGAMHRHGDCHPGPDAPLEEIRATGSGTCHQGGIIEITVDRTERTTTCRLRAHLSDGLQDSRRCVALRLLRYRRDRRELNRTDICHWASTLAQDVLHSRKKKRAAFGCHLAWIADELQFQCVARWLDIEDTRIVGMIIHLNLTNAIRSGLNGQTGIAWIIFVDQDTIEQWLTWRQSSHALLLRSWHSGKGRQRTLRLLDALKKCVQPPFSRPHPQRHGRHAKTDALRAWAAPTGPTGDGHAKDDIDVTDNTRQGQREGCLNDRGHGDLTARGALA